MSIERSGDTACASSHSLVYEYFDVGLRGEFIATTVLVSVLSWAAEALTSFGQRSTRLAARAIIIRVAEGTVATDRAWILP